MRIFVSINKIILFNMLLGAAQMAIAAPRGQDSPRPSGLAEPHAITSTAASANPDTNLPAPLPRQQKSLQEIAIELVNPINGLQSLSSEFLYQPYQGELPNADRQTLRSISFTPSFPFHLSNGKNIVLRATIPVNLTQPTYTYTGEPRDFTDWRIRQEAGSIAASGDFSYVHAHMYDISYDLAYGGINEHGLIAMVGIAGVLPTSEDGSGARHLYLLGPEIAVGKKFAGGIAGGWVHHLTKVAATSPDVDHNANLSELKLFFAHEMGNGWQILSNSNITYDWEGEKDNKLLLPLGGGIAKTIRIGSLPVRFVVEAQKYLETPSAFGPDWLLKFSMAFVDIKRSRF
ncbi:MAG TPA: hypothetical protein VIS54_04995 [Psychromonas sp.]